MKKTIAIMIGAVVGLSGITHVQAHEHGGEAYSAEAVTFELDAAHSLVGFSIRHLGLANIRGLFHDYAATIRMVDHDITTLSVKAKVHMASVDTANQQRDDHLRSPDYLEVETYPHMTFKSSGVVAHGDGHALVGDLTIKGITREVTLPVTMAGPVEDAWGNTKMGFEFGGSVNRHDFGVANDSVADRALGNQIRFDIQVQVVKP